MTKFDTEVLVLYLLIRDGRYSLPQDLFRVCRDLKLTETRARNLWQRVQMVYMQYDLDEAKRQFVRLVSSESLERRGDRITFIIRDPLLRQYFEEWVAACDGFTDSSFNKNLVTISTDLLQCVIEKLAVVEFEDVAGRFTGELAVLNDAVDMKTLLREFTKKFAGGAGDTAGRLTVNALAVGLQKLILGG